MMEIYFLSNDGIMINKGALIRKPILVVKGNHDMSQSELFYPETCFLAILSYDISIITSLTKTLMWSSTDFTFLRNFKFLLSSATFTFTIVLKC